MGLDWAPLDYFHADRVLDAFTVTRSSGKPISDEIWNEAMKGMDL